MYLYGRACVCVCVLCVYVSVFVSMPVIHECRSHAAKCLYGICYYANIMRGKENTFMSLFENGRNAVQLQNIDHRN